MKKKTFFFGVIFLCVVIAVICTQITFFVIQPIGALPEGKTVVIFRVGNDKFTTRFIDSADGICERVQGGVSLLCRGAAMGGVLGNTTIIMRLPYSQFLYEISTNGKVYDK